MALLYDLWNQPHCFQTKKHSRGCLTRHIKVTRSVSVAYMHGFLIFSVSFEELPFSKGTFRLGSLESFAFNFPEQRLASDDWCSYCITSSVAWQGWKPSMVPRSAQQVESTLALCLMQAEDCRVHMWSHLRSWGSASFSNCWLVTLQTWLMKGWISSYPVAHRGFVLARGAGRVRLCPNPSNKLWIYLLGRTARPTATWENLGWLKTQFVIPHWSREFFIGFNGLTLRISWLSLCEMKCTLSSTLKATWTVGPI